MFVCVYVRGWMGGWVIMSVCMGKAMSEYVCMYTSCFKIEKYTYTSTQQCALMTPCDSTTAYF